MASIDSFFNYNFSAWSRSRSNTNTVFAQSPQATSNTASPPNIGDILQSSLNYKEQNVPSITTGDPVSALRVLSDISFFASLYQQAQTPIIPNLDNKSVGLKTDILGGIKSSLQTLDGTVTQLLQNGSLNTRSTQSTQSNVVEATADNTSPLTSVSVVAQQVASGNVLVSNAQSSTMPALGLTGSFYVNGYQIQVASTDSIVSIKDKINFGSDFNHNGVLDGPQDINGTGKPGIISIPPSQYGPGIYINKDPEGKGYLYPSEDVNNTGQLVGGSKQNMVSATIENNRLKLTSLASGSTKINLRDPNNILLSLGFFAYDSKGMSVQKDTQLASQGGANLDVAPQQAVITVNGKTYTSDTNTFSNVIGGTTLTVKQASTTPTQVSIISDPGKVVDQIKTLFNNFNDAIQKINDSMTQSQAFETDTDLQRLRNKLTQTQANIINTASQNAAINAVSSGQENQSTTGINVVNTSKNTLQEIAVTNISQSIQDQLGAVFSSTPGDLLRRLSSLGIQTKQDNTFSIDEGQLQRALTINTKGVLSLFTDPTTGILPQLKNQLSSILNPGIGQIDFKTSETNTLSSVPLALSKNFQSYVQNLNLKVETQNLITVA